MGFGVAESCFSGGGNHSFVPIFSFGEEGGILISPALLPHRGSLSEAWVFSPIDRLSFVLNSHLSFHPGLSKTIARRRGAFWVPGNCHFLQCHTKAAARRLATQRPGSLLRRTGEALRATEE